MSACLCRFVIIVNMSLVFSLEIKKLQSTRSERPLEELLTFTDASSSLDRLNDLKRSKLLQKWSTANFEPLRVSTRELQLVTRTSFSTLDYYADILAAAKENPNPVNKFSFAIGCIISTLFSALIVPQLDINGTVKNFIGLMGLFGPFIVLLTANIFPALFFNLKKDVFKSDKEELIQRDRVIYHEAGHFLACYLCGIPTIDYDVDGGIDAISIAARIPSLSSIEYELKSPSAPSATSSQSEILIASRTGNLLIVSMAGVVAETLRCGNSLGGKEDFPTAVGILRRYGVRQSGETDDYLRWAVLKALNLLRIHRDELDQLAENMRLRKTVAECVVGIEGLHAGMAVQYDEQKIVGNDS
jgi:hypothetical protein